MSTLNYDYNTNCNPIPPSEAALPAVTAERFVKVFDEKPKHLEGICFDRTGQTMFFVCTDIGRLFKMDMDEKKPVEIWSCEGLRSFGLKIHQNGNLYVCCFGTSKRPGIAVVDQEGNQLDFLMEGYWIDDIIFAADGSFYASEFIGDYWDRKGCVYHVSADGKEITPVVPNLAAPNGVALSPDEQILWITEYNGGRLLRVPLNGGWASVPYAFTGYHGPDSCETDADGNLYVSMTFQSRILIFNKDGFPIGQVLTPGRKVGRNLVSTHATVRPGTKELYISCSDDMADEGSWILKSESFATAIPDSFPMKQ